MRLKKHPEGGYYRETYRSRDILPKSVLPKRFKRERPASTCIYFLLEGKDISALHRLRSDEIWHHYAGGSIVLHVFAPNGRHSKFRLGPAPQKGDAPQVLIKTGLWFGAELTHRRSYALLGCTVAPGFHCSDFELGDRKKLLKLFPSHKALIEKLT